MVIHVPTQHQVRAHVFLQEHVNPVFLEELFRDCRLLYLEFVQYVQEVLQQIDYYPEMMELVQDEMHPMLYYLEFFKHVQQVVERGPH
ncbi:hypothetical protein HPB52_018150 [Rhipicephalus sanguineus]|uniref:Uncharacterized protein n=1 Tax=Rhipicephalus sanguineus TaxID=34632 RepID=A0A9D4PLT9_RHISA|nr:hypothetical protein HPB52_018150 [Rhipicephalus sanguineus]